jgi:hypothetical protein
MVKLVLFLTLVVTANVFAQPPDGRRCECDCVKNYKRGTPDKLCPISSEIVERTTGKYRCEPDWLVRKEADSLDTCNGFNGQVCNGWTMGEHKKKTKGRLAHCLLK